ncbi:MAG: hypothetical protein EOP35_14195 [Rubrivivax sp.]|nr:MAG: hypothetical protein EOP35_14195 [Rubrivivax sp.]
MRTSEFTMAMPGSPEKKRESLDAQKVLRQLAKELAPLGFRRTKPSFFTRPTELVVEFVHIHKYTFGPHFRIHFGVRVLNDTTNAVGLNGPSIDGVGDANASTYKALFTYGADAASMAASAELMARVVREQGEPWFASIRSTDALLNSPDRVLVPQAQDALRQAMAGNANPVAVGTSRRQLGLPPQP